ncbi:MAG: hypothetical protein QNJ15_01770 [Erythrobacter sp.]|nr:hypothetical protein [Erythrobacter sp.]
MIGAEKTRRRGGPIAMLGMLAMVWIGGRAMLWESPFAEDTFDLPQAVARIAGDQARSTKGSAPPVAERTDLTNPFAPFSGRSLADAAALLGTNSLLASRNIGLAQASDDDPFPVAPRVAAGHQLLLMAALAHLPMPRAVEDAAHLLGEDKAGDRLHGSRSGRAPFLTPLGADAQNQRADRWSLDAWAYWRQGSNATAVSQGRVPIYGASQAGASLRYRLAPRSGFDPMVYARAYRALVNNGETEVALGAAARPIAALPLRAFAEIRYTDGPFRNEARPAVFLATELPPQDLPAGLTAEAYAQAGYVGGEDPTPFADGQVVVSREVANFDLASISPAKFSLGAGAWGGAQMDAARLDVGPTVRIDLTIGQVPARVSVDWREQVAGDAAPSSGLAATLSTRF